MYDITKTRILLTTAVFAAAAAALAGGANARALVEGGSGLGAEPAAEATQGSGTFSVVETCAALDLEQLRGVLVNEPAIRAATPDLFHECSGVGAEPAAEAAQGSGTFSVGEICAALELEQLRGVLINEPAIRRATPGATQECSHAGAAKSIASVFVPSEVAQGVSEWAVISRTSTSQKRVVRPRPNTFPDGRRSVP